MTKTERILQSLSEMGFREIRTTSRKFKCFQRPEWLVQSMVDRGFTVAAKSNIYVGRSAAFRSGQTVTTSRSLDAATTIKRWQKIFTEQNPDQEVTEWK